MNMKELEEHLHNVHNLTRSANELRDKYEKSMQGDAPRAEKKKGRDVGVN